jgi:hypothetical protein
MALQRLRETAEETKIELSQVSESQTSLPFITRVAEESPRPRRSPRPGRRRQTRAACGPLRTRSESQALALRVPAGDWNHDGDLYELWYGGHQS